MLDNTINQEAPPYIHQKSNKMDIKPFKINIPDEELSLLQHKLKLARIPPNYTDWRDDNNIDSNFIRKTVDYWLNEYDWREEEAKINQIPQFATQIDVSDGFGTLDIHFAHSRSSKPDAVPLIFIHGWPGSFLEVTKGLKRLNDEGFHVVAPSLPGYGFSSYPRKAGFDLRKVAEVLQKLMLRLGYDQFVVQGGDWGSHISRIIGLQYPKNALAVHTNMVCLN
jgi:pimeloyl-ACP methyl ester carboxylesterase